jgi:hypothetical protein
MSSSENSHRSTERPSPTTFSSSPRTVTVAAGRGGQLLVKRTARKGLRDLPPLDLRTPSGRELPF